MASTKHLTRGSGAGVSVNFDQLCPPLKKFESEKLPLLKEVIGMVKYLVENSKEQYPSYEDAINNVSHTLYYHWIQRNVYPFTVPSIRKKLQIQMQDYRKLYRQKTETRGPTWIKNAEKLMNSANTLFDIFCKDDVKRKALEDKYKLPMLEEDYEFLKSMRSKERQMVCESKTDISYYTRIDEKDEMEKRYRKRQNSSFNEVVNSEKINLDDGVECDDRIEVTSDNETVDRDYECDSEREIQGDKTHNPPTKKRKSCIFSSKSEASSDVRETRFSFKEGGSDASSGLGDNAPNQAPANIPVVIPVANDIEELIDPHNKHVRKSPKLIRDDVYNAMALMAGRGLSSREIQESMKIIANTIFNCNWKMPNENDENDENDERVVDLDTLPTRQAIDKMLAKVEVVALKLTAEKMVESKNEGKTLSHCTDSTSRPGVGTFSTQGVHINRDEYLPFPTLQISRETTDNLADHIEIAFDILEEASGIDGAELYDTISVHVTDATNHNKGIAVALANKMDRDVPAGQIECVTHGVLAFDRDIVQEAHKVEDKLGMENIFKGFLVEVGIDPKNDSVAIASIKWMLALFGPDNLAMPWNYHNEFLQYLKRNNRKSHLINVKDARFGCLSRCAGIACHHWADFSHFLDTHDYITNKLACLVRHSLDNEWIKIVIAVVATLGIHVISPFHSISISNTMTHADMREFLTDMYNDMRIRIVTADLFQLNNPVVGNISPRLFDSVKKEYHAEVVVSIRNLSAQYLNDCITLAQKIIPKFSESIARQRGAAYGIGEGNNTASIFSQVKDGGNIEDTPINNIQQERELGGADNRLKKKGSLNAVSRDILLDRTAHLRKDNPDCDFTKVKPSTVKRIKQIKIRWKERQEQCKAEALTEKEEQRLRVDNRKINILERLRAQGGPFVSADEVEVYLADPTTEDKVKASRMRDEVTYARDTNTALPKVHPVFKIMNTNVTPRRLLTPREFGENLKIYFGKKEGRTFVTLQEYRTALNTP